MTKPIIFSEKFPFSSVVQNTESEVIAKNIMVILSRTGGKWRKLSWKEYKEERQKDRDFTEREKGYFKNVQSYTVDESAARSFSKSWRKL